MSLKHFFGIHCWHTVEDSEYREQNTEHGVFINVLREVVIEQQICCHCGLERTKRCHGTSYGGY